MTEIPIKRKYKKRKPYKTASTTYVELQMKKCGLTWPDNYTSDLSLDAAQQKIILTVLNVSFPEILDMENIYKILKWKK